MSLFFQKKWFKPTFPMAIAMVAVSYFLLIRGLGLTLLSDRHLDGLPPLALGALLFAWGGFWSCGPSASSARVRGTAR